MLHMPIDSHTHYNGFRARLVKMGKIEGIDGDAGNFLLEEAMWNGHDSIGKTARQTALC